MPREQINYPDLTFAAKNVALHDARGGSDIPGVSVVDWNSPSIHVAWNPANNDNQMPSWIQVGFEVDTNYLDMFERETENQRFGDRLVLWTDTLSPGDIDRMIKTLKKAKKRAFPQN